MSRSQKLSGSVRANQKGLSRQSTIKATREVQVEVPSISEQNILDGLAVDCKRVASDIEHLNNELDSRAEEDGKAVEPLDV